MIDDTPMINKEINDCEAQEEKTLGSLSPLKTLLSLIIGPLISELTNSVYGVFNSFLISKGEGPEGLEVLTSLYIFDMVVYSFGILSSISAASYIPYLLAKNKKDRATKLIVDLLKIVLILGVLYPLIVLPITKPLVIWLSGKKDVANDSFKYMCISSGFSFVMFGFQLHCGILQGLGKTWLYGCMQITALLLDMIVFLPLFIFVFKWGVWCVALSQVVSQSIPTLILFGMLMSDKLFFDLKPSMFFSRISKDTWKAIKIGFASFVLNISEAFPTLALQKYIMLVASHVGVLDEVLSTYSIISRLYGLAICILIAFDSAFLPPASYAYGKRLYRRVLKLLLHTLWLTFLWGATASVLIIVFARQIFSIFTNDSKVIDIAVEISAYCFYTLPIYCFHSLIVSYLQAVERPGRAIVISIVTTLFPTPIISTIIYYTIGRNSLQWIFSTYIFDDLSSFLISIVFSVSIMYKMYKTRDGDEFSDGNTKDPIPDPKSIETICIE